MIRVTIYNVTIVALDLSRVFEESQSFASENFNLHIVNSVLYEVVIIYITHIYDFY